MVGVLVVGVIVLDMVVALVISVVVALVVGVLVALVVAWCGVVVGVLLRG